MIDIFLTSLIIIGLLFIFLYKNKWSDNSQGFFSKDSTQVLKGIAAVIVLMVHVPKEHGNPLQDMIGSFAFVAVTYFFMVSAFGMQMSAQKHGRGYLRQFWINRLAVLLIPMFLVNIVDFLLNLYIYLRAQAEIEWHRLWRLNSYVSVLLTYCALFWLVEISSIRFKIVERYKIWILCLSVLLSSIIIYFFMKDYLGASAGWCYERIGLVWGLLLYDHFPAIRRWLGEKTRRKIILFGTIALILGASYLAFKHYFFIGEYLLKIVLGLAIIVLLLLVMSRVKFSNRLAFILGAISYEFYLLHEIVLQHLAYAFPLRSGLYLILAVAATLLLAYIIHRIASPLISRLRR